MAKLPKYICLQVVPNGLDVELELVEPEKVAEDLGTVAHGGMTEHERGEWDMFVLLSSAWYGKQAYFIQYPKKDTVYSRISGKYMTVQEAIKEFVDRLWC